MKLEELLEEEGVWFSPSSKPKTGRTIEVKHKLPLDDEDWKKGEATDYTSYDDGKFKDGIFYYKRKDMSKFLPAFKILGWRYKGEKTMKLRKIMQEMSLPNVNTPEDAVASIKQAYQTAVVGKQPNADFYGPLTAALEFLQKSTAPERYEREIKMGIAAKKSMDAFRATKATQQPQFTANKGLQNPSFEKKV